MMAKAQAAAASAAEAAQKAASSASAAATTKANEAAAAAKAKYEEEAPKYKAAFAEAAEGTRAKVKEGMEKLEPSARAFLKSPTMQYLKQNEHAVKAALAVFVAVGLPGAGLLLSMVGYVGLEQCGELVVQFLQMAAPML